MAPCLRNMLVRVVCVLSLVAVATSCTLQEVPDWGTFYDRQPRSILVLPAENETTDVEAPRFLMATIARPLIGRGYYVFPIEATSQILASEGFTSGGELTDVSPRKFRDYFGADGILFTTIKTWDTSYAILASSVTVTLSHTLVDTGTGEVVWSGVSTAQRKSGVAFGGGGLIGLAIAAGVAAANAAMTAALTDYVPLAREANAQAFRSIPPGVYHAEFQATKDRLVGEWEAYKRAKAEQEQGG